MTLARYHARETIKRELKAQGIKLASVESCEITRAANRYIDDHPEIIAFATEEYHRSRCKWPIATTKAKETRFGRKLKLTQHQIAEALHRREAGEALVEIGRSYNVSHSTISRL